MASSTLAAVTLALQNLLQAAMPPKVEVTTLPLSAAGKFPAKGKFVARVNVTCHQVSPGPSMRNISLARIDAPMENGPKASPLNALFLVTILGTSKPVEIQSEVNLLEASFRAIELTSVLNAASLSAALPGSKILSPTAMARVVPQVFSLSEMQAVFSSLQVAYRPTLAYLVTITDE